MTGDAPRGDGQDHVLDTTSRPAACSCGKATYAGSPSFVRERHAVHVDDVVLRTLREGSGGSGA